MDEKQVRAEDAAEPCTVAAWRCKVCGRVWLDERAARYCHATDYACACGRRRPKAYIHCKECERRRRAAIWYAKPEVEWDGEFPIGTWDNDRYFWDADQLLEYLHDDDDDAADNAADERDIEIESLRLTSCQEVPPRDFAMNDYLSDSLGEDRELDTAEIDRTVNEWIQKQRPLSYQMTGQRLSLTSLRKHLGT